MNDNQHIATLEAILVELLDIARALLHSLPKESTYQKQAAVLGHISCTLLFASETSHCLKSDFWTDLEKLCKWHIDESSPWTFERFRFFQRRDPKIWLCQGATRHAREGFLAYARSTAADQDLLLYFRANDPVRLPLTSNDSLPFYQLHNNEERDTPEELPSVVTRNLYLALEEYSHCGEPYSQVPKTDKIQHEVRLCLVDRSQISGDFAVFDLHSLCSPPTNPLSSGSFGHWQQLRIHLSIKQRNKVRIAEPGSLCNFSIRNRNQDNVPKAEGIESLSKKEFCELLRVDHGPIKLCLQIKDQSIYDLENSEESDQKLLKTDSIPLAEVLNAYDLSRKRRLTLGYTLARSVWQYYNSDLANASWSATSVQFMLEIDMLSRSQPRITSQPCFVVRFQQEDDGLPECYVSGHITHRYPRIFSLGRLLFEIGQDSHHDYLQQESHSFEQETNDAHFSMKEQVRQKNWPHFGQDDNASDNLRDLYKNATLACLNNDLFKPTCDRCRARNTKCIGRVSTSCRACNEARHSCTYKSFPRDSREALDLGAQSRREILLEKVVLPLREALRLVDWDTSVSKPEVIPLKMSTDDISAPLSQMRRSLMTRSKRSGDPLSATHKRFRCNLTKFYDDHELSTDELTSKRRQYEEWKTMFMNTAERFPDPVSANASRLKIAVLDTGLDTDHPDIKHVLDRIWVYNRSDDIFGSCENSSVKDSKGHGTHIVGLVLEYTADADVYVADITEQGEVDHELVAKAILCAVKAKVDIISISFGFRDRVPGIEQAIEHAKRQGIHTLAAASNDGGNEGRSWPAKHRDVFCIHSTDAKGNHSKFNPTAIKGLNFATVGEAVVSSWPSHLPKSLYAQEDISGDPDDASTATKSGTSYATPIAACIVAFLLHFADMHLPKYALQLRKYSVMESVLKYVAGEERNGFNYLTLQSGPNHLFGRDLEDIRTAMKIVIDQSG